MRGDREAKGVAGARFHAGRLDPPPRRLYTNRILVLEIPLRTCFLSGLFADSLRAVLSATAALICVSSGQVRAVPQAPVSMAPAPKPLTFQSLFGPGPTLGAGGGLPEIVRWRADGERYLQRVTLPLAGGQVVNLLSVQAGTGATETLFASDVVSRAMKAAGAKNPEVNRSLGNTAALDAAENRLLVPGDGDLWSYHRPSGRALRLTRTPDLPETDTLFSPDGRWVSFVRGNNLWIVPADGSAPERAVTTDGGPLRLNGRLGWVYEEEIYGRGGTSGCAWSPDSRRIAFLRTDESPVKPFPILDSVPRDQKLTEQRYPLPGDPNPVVTLAIATVAESVLSAPSVRDVDTAPYPDQDRLIVRFGWTPASDRVVLEVQNRIQNRLDLLVVPADGGGRPTRLLTETTAAWVDPIALPLWLKDGSFLWQSDRTGWRHLYRYRPDGILIGAVTTGDWDIREVYGADMAFVYFSGTMRDSTGVDLFRAGLAGNAPAPPERLTERVGTHHSRMNAAFTRYLDTFSDLWTPPQMRLFDLATGNRERRVVGDNAAAVARRKGYFYSRPARLTIKARDGFPLEAILIKPANFDPSKRYPVYQEVYGGPGFPLVRNAWSGGSLFYQLLAQKGYVVWLCDNRSAGGKGAKSQWTMYKNPGEGELRDVEDGLAWLKQQAWVDSNRIAIYGWSYGGFLVEYALTHSKSFKVGIAGAGVSDWRLYDSVYTERYLDLPSANPDGYLKSAPLAAAASLSGKLLLLHGLADDNVHLQNTLQFVYALERAEKQYDLSVYPRSRHGIGEPPLYRHLQQRILDFLAANL
ncbi:MAG: DPP IV N-terminal domain-containing protein [Cytophagales bacterium]|nr:DPP IV N-terminal domain-containing protein [Armatimonadota bacterium]